MQKYEFKNEYEKAKAYLEKEKETYKNFSKENYCYTNKISMSAYDLLMKTDNSKNLWLIHDGKSHLGGRSLSELSVFLHQKTEVQNSFISTIKDNPLVIIKKDLFDEIKEKQK